MCFWKVFLCTSPIYLLGASVFLYVYIWIHHMLGLLPCVIFSTYMPFMFCYLIFFIGHIYLFLLSCPYIVLKFKRSLNMADWICINISSPEILLDEITGINGINSQEKRIGKSFNSTREISLSQNMKNKSLVWFGKAEKTETVACRESQ